MSFIAVYLCYLSTCTSFLVSYLYYIKLNWIIYHPATNPTFAAPTTHYFTHWGKHVSDLRYNRPIAFAPIMFSASSTYSHREVHTCTHCKIRKYYFICNHLIIWSKDSILFWWIKNIFRNIYCIFYNNFIC